MANAYTCDFCGRLLSAKDRLSLEIIGISRTVGFSFIDTCTDCNKAFNDLAKQLRNEVVE